MTIMLYKFSEEEKPRKQKIAGMNIDYIVVEASEVEENLDEGWSKTPIAAKELHEGVISGKIFPEIGTTNPESSNSDVEPSEEIELDKDGLPWDERINLKDKSKGKKGSWKIKPGTKKDVIEAVRAEIKPTEEDEPFQNTTEEENEEE